MKKYDLAGMQKDAMFILENSTGFVELEGEWSEFRSKCREVCDHFLTLATASLRIDKKRNFFFQNLCRSAENWRRFILSSKDHYKKQAPLMYKTPLYAGLVANDKGLINNLVSALPKSFVKGEEYEDDFLVAKIHALLCLNDLAVDEEVSSALNALNATQQSLLKAKLFKSLLDGDENNFWLAFQELSTEYKVWVKERSKALTTSKLEFVIHKFLWLEGLIWLRLAKQKGFSLTKKTDKYCPLKLVMGMNEKFYGDWTLVKLAKFSKDDYWILTECVEDDAAMIDYLPDDCPDYWEFTENESLIKNISGKIKLEFDKEHPEKIKLYDFLNTSMGLLIISSPAKDVFDRLKTEDVEYIPAEIYDHKSTLVSEEYFIINTLKAQPIIDREKTECEMSSCDPDSIMFFDELHLDVDAIDQNAKLFLAENENKHYFITNEVLTALKLAKITGIKVYKAEGWDGNTLSFL